MKKLIVMLSFLKRNLLPLTVIAVTMTVSLFMIITTVGEYQYRSYARKVFADSGLAHSVYFCRSYDPLREDRDSNQWIYDAAAAYPAFSQTVTYTTDVDSLEGEIVNVMYQSDALLQAFRPKVSRGRWLKPDAEEPEVVLGGFACKGRRLGEYITLEGGVTARVVGLIEGNALWPSFNRSGTRMSADDLFESVDSCAFINAAQTDPALIERNRPQRARNAIICFREDADAWEIAELRAFLEQQGLCYDYETLLLHADEDIADALRRALPLPLFLVTVMSISVLCVGAVILQRSMSEQAKYYLIGCSKREGILLITGALFMAFLVPILLNTVLAMCFPHFLRLGRYSEPEYIINGVTLLPMGGYAAVMLILLWGMPRLFYKKLSPIQVYRRNLS